MNKRDSENYIKDITQPATYDYEDRRYIVTPHFQANGNETLGSLILKMMKNDIESDRV